jgi:hypothetical protein
MRCASCGEEILTQEAMHDGIVVDGDDRFHVECAPAEAVSTGLSSAEEEAENERRREEGDVPLPPADIVGDGWIADLKVGDDLPPDDGGKQAKRYEELLTGRFPCTPHSVAGPRPEGGPLFPRDDHDPAEVRGAQMERDERFYGGRFDEDGLGY